MEVFGVLEKRELLITTFFFCLHLSLLDFVLSFLRRLLPPVEQLL